MWKGMLAALCAALVPATASERVVCPVAADNHVYATPWDYATLEATESYYNFGAANWLTIKGREYFALLAFDTSAAKGLAIEKATLRFYRNPSLGPGVPLHTIGISTISGSGPWAEGGQTAGRAQPGASNYFFARVDQQPWSYSGSDLTDVVFGPGGSLYTYLQPQDAGDGWFEAELPVEIANALVSGDQYGLLLTDEKGQTNPRHYIGTRHGRFGASLILEGSRSDQTPPAAVRSFKPDDDVIESTVEEARALGRTTLRPGSVVLRFGGAGDDNGKGIATRYELRYSQNPITDANFASAALVPRWCLNPLAPKPHPLAIGNSLLDEVSAVVEALKLGEAYYFAARAIDKAGNAGPLSPLGWYRAYSRSSPRLPELTAHSRQPTSHNPRPTPPSGPSPTC